MPCPRCAAPETTEQARRTTLGYRTFRCPACRRACNERTGAPYNHLRYPTDLVLLVVLWRLRYKRYYPMRGFGSFASAARFCAAHEERRQYFRSVAASGERVSLAERRRRFRERRTAVMAEVEPVSAGEV